MKFFFREHATLLIILAMFAIGFGLFIHMARSTKPDSASNDTYKEVNFDSRMVKGNEDAPIHMIQYSDFLCPSCSYLSTQIMPSIEQKYIDNGEMAFEFRPMAFIAPGSKTAAEGAFCAVDQDKFWPYHDAVYAHVWNNAFSKSVDPTRVTILTADIIKSIAQSAGLDKQFDSCLDTNEHSDDVSAATQQAHLHNISSTPYVMLNGSDVSSSATNLTALEALIEAQAK